MSTSFPEEQRKNYLVGKGKPPVHTQFKPGISPNPGGVRKGTVFISERMKFLQSLSPADFEAYEPQTVADEIAKTRVKAARSSKMQGLAEAREVLDRTEGKAQQKMQIEAAVIGIADPAQLIAWRKSVYGDTWETESSDEEARYYFELYQSEQR